MWIVITLALILRLIFFNQSLWLDESIEALALQGHFGPLLSYSLSDFQPPLYHFILRSWTSLLGFSEISLRLPSLISGLMTVYFVLKIGEYLGGKKIGVIAGLLVATNPLLIYYSQEGRTYAMTTFFVTASFYYFIKLLKSSTINHRSSTIYYILYTILFLWTSYLSWFVLITQAIYVIWKKRYDLLFIQTLSASTLVLWLPSLYHSLQIGLGDAVAIPGWGKVVGGVSLKALALTWVKLNIGRISFDSNYLYGGIVSLLAILHFYMLRHVRSKILFIWLVVPVVLASAVSLFVPIYSYTRVLFIVPAYLLLLALGSAKLSRVVIVCNTVFLMIFWVNPRFHKEDWRSLTNYLNTQSGTVTLPSLKQNAPFIYYGLSLTLQSSQDPLATNKVFYVRYVEEAFDPRKLGQANFDKSGNTITSQQSYSGIQLDIYEKWQ